MKYLNKKPKAVFYPTLKLCCFNFYLNWVLCVFVSFVWFKLMVFCFECMLDVLFIVILVIRTRNHEALVC